MYVSFIATTEVFGYPCKSVRAYMYSCALKPVENDFIKHIYACKRSSSVLARDESKALSDSEVGWLLVEFSESLV